MAQKQELISLRVDDVALIYTVVKSMGVAEAVNDHYMIHGNWKGISPGAVPEIWLCYILSTCDHRLCTVEQWVEERVEVLRALSGLENLSSLDFTDDKLRFLLKVFARDEDWSKTEGVINRNGLSVYRLVPPSGTPSLPVVRLDAAPMQGYGTSVEGGLLQYGYHKQHAALPQFKVKLCVLDNEVNNFAYPITHLTVPGNVADDVLYQEIISKSKAVLSEVEEYAAGNLFLGDKKFGSLSNRIFVVSQKDYYLMPLSYVQLSRADRQNTITASDAARYESVYRRVETAQGEKSELVAYGFETQTRQTGTIDEAEHIWTQRELYVYSISHAKAQHAALDGRLNKALQQIEALNESKKGKRVLKTEGEYREAADNILKTNKVENLIECDIKVSETIKKIRAYGERPARTETELSFTIDCSLMPERIEERKKLTGWQVYATNVPKDLLSFEACVWKYRYQSNIESRFDDLRNKVAPLLPVYLHTDEGIKGLVNILLLALKVCSVIEYKIAKQLQDNKEELKNIYEGNPKRGTNRPSAKRVFNAFNGVSISLVFRDNRLQLALMTRLEPVQLKILELLGIPIEVYTQLTDKIQMFFTPNNFSEI